MALTERNIKIKMTALGTYSDSMIPAIKHLIEVDKMCVLLSKEVKDYGATIREKSREGNYKRVINPAFNELAKMQALKGRLLSELLLTGASLERAKLKAKLEDGYEDEEPA